MPQEINEVRQEDDGAGPASSKPRSDLVLPDVTVDKLMGPDPVP